MIIKRILYSTLLIQLISIVLFLWLAWQADQAMSKDGIGNLELSNKYNHQAGIAFHVAATFWLVSIAVAILCKRFNSSQAQMAICVPPLVGFTGWLLLWFI